jgi:carbamoyltransferase
VKRNYVGLSSGNHGASIAVADSRGEVVFAESLERGTQNKLAWNMVPDDVMTVGKILAKHCEPDASLVVASTWSTATTATAPLRAHAIDLLRRPSDPAGRAAKADDFEDMRALANANRLAGMNLELRILQSGLHHPEHLVRKRYDHHLTHAAAACYASPFRDATCVVVDTHGERSSVSVYDYRDGELRLASGAERSGKASLGEFFALLCSACGFDPRAGDQRKVMDLAPCGTLDQQLYETLRSAIDVRGCQLQETTGTTRGVRALVELADGPVARSKRGQDVAHTGQRVFAEIYLRLLEDIAKLGGSKNLVLGGGCALNAPANGRVVRETGFHELYVPPAPGNEGTSIGAALLAYRADHPTWMPSGAIQSPFVGSSVSRDAVDRLKRFGSLSFADVPRDRLFGMIADEIARGAVVGWIQGRAELGGHALGNRSILADPRSTRAKDTIMARVKGGSEHRSFSPAILCEDGASYFEDFQPSPYRERALRFRQAVVDTVPGVVHADGTGRVQTVTRALNEPFYDLIAAFKRATGIPVLLHTSFNAVGKPMVHSVEDAVSIFVTTGIDLLVVGDTVFTKSHAARVTLNS